VVKLEDELVEDMYVLLVVGEVPEELSPNDEVVVTELDA
jgi:hypothetical protein